MNTFTIIPAKPLEQSKTRLASVLPLPTRVALSRRLLRRTIGLARQISQVVVVSRDVNIRRLAKQAGAWALVESGSGLNEALRQASAWASVHGGDSILVVPGDLPLLKLEDLSKIVQAGQPPWTVVIAPCHRQEGTNALFLHPLELIEFAFGPSSFEKHQQLARNAGLEPIIYCSPTVAFDLDLPADLERLYYSNESIQLINP